jgi:glutamate-1-semialdehyde 2,1-aminomutase
MVKPALGLRSKDLYERAKKIIPGGVNSPVRAFHPYPFFVCSAKGSKLYDVDGRAYIDYSMAYGTLMLGHGCEVVLDAVKAQLDRGTLYGAPTEMEVEFAELVRELYPSMEMLRFVNSGTEATMHAVRVARGFTGKKKLVKFEGSFHGAHDSVLVKAGSGAAWLGMPSSLGVPEETARNTIVLPFNDFEALEETLEKEGNEIAAVIIEPVIANSGLILPEKGYLKFLRKLTRDYGVVLIFDEIVTGFRVSLGGAQEYYNVKPDMTTLGKILGGGFPIAAFGGKKEIMEKLSPLGDVYQAGTFSGNPISVIAGYTTVRYLVKNRSKIYSRLGRKCKELAKAVADLSERHRLAVQVHSLASMFQVFFSSQSINNYVSAKLSDVRKFHAYFMALLENGIFIPPSQFETCFISVAHSDKDFELTIEVVDRALSSAASMGGS